MNLRNMIRLFIIAILLTSCSGKTTPTSTVAPATATFLATSTPTPSPVERLSVDLLAYYPFNGNAEDASGNGHDAEAIQAQLIPDRLGNPSSAYRFDGLESILKVPVERGFDLPQNFSIGLWVNINFAMRSSDVMLINKHRASQDGDGSWWLALEKPGKTLRFGATSTSNFEFVKTSQELSLNQWHCIVYTYNKASQKWDFYLDSQAAGSGTVQFNIRQPALDLYIGAEETTSGELHNFFSGDLDELMFFKRALSPAEVGDLCGEAVPGSTAAETSQAAEPTQTLNTRPTTAPNTQPTLTVGPRITSTPTLIPPVSAQLFDGLGPIASIYWGSDNEITLLNLDGTIKENLFSDHGSSTKIEYHLSWSPDGHYIAFNKTNYDDIYILSVDSKTAVNITQTGDAFEFDPTWSPNGQWIAYTYIPPNSDSRNIYVMHPDGSGITQLTDCDGDCEGPNWSPDGQFIAYSYNYQIFVMKADGSEPRSLTHNAQNFSPAWSPDGKTIAFLRSLDFNQNFLYLMNPDGSGLTALSGENDSPWNSVSWSPDNHFIAFQNSPKQGGIGLYIVNVQTKAITRLTDFGYYAPAWYPLMESGTASEVIPVAREDCTNGWTRLTAGGQARVMGAQTDLPNRVRSEPVVGNNIIGEIYPGTFLRVVEGPVCVNGLVFWKVQSTAIPGGIGWTAEGDGTEYYLEPYSP